MRELASPDEALAEVGGVNVHVGAAIDGRAKELAFAARRGAHVLVSGPSGSGKELAAAMIHALSQRANGPFVARNAATLPVGLIDAELFGNAYDGPAVNGELSLHVANDAIYTGQGEQTCVFNLPFLNSSIREVIAANRTEALR